MIQKKLFLFLCCLWSISLLAQSDKYDRSERNTFWDGESYYIYGDYLTAVRKLESLTKVDESYSELFFLLGNSYFQLDDYKKAAPYLEKGIPFNNDAHFLLAQIYLYDANLETAKEKVDVFEKSFDEKNSSFKKIEIQQFKKYLINAKNYSANAEIVNISNLGKQVNSENGEYVPVISSDEEVLIFTSRRLHSMNELDPTGEPFEDIYYSEKQNGRNNWSSAKLLPGSVNSGRHDACVGLSPDGNMLFLFRTNENLVGGDLYMSIKIDKKWSTPIRMDENINNFNSIEPSASISLDGRTFYFSSNRAGGYGGFDIYKVVKLPNNKWSLPLNLGPKINTPFDDDAPFIHPDDKTLYFSSQGHESMGGFDIFKSQKLDTTWSTPENLGVPTNSTKDDIYFTISANEQHGYYSSDKEGGFGDQDIYQIDYLEKSLRQSVIRGTVLNEETKEVLEADITLLEFESGELEGVYISNADDGRFIFIVNPNVRYEIIVETDGYKEHNEMLNYSVEELMETQRLNFNLKPID